MADKIKLSLAALLVAVGMVGFYMFDTYSLLYRTIALLFIVIVAAFIASKTVIGAETVAFIRNSVIEMKKVVWPNKKETTHTTLIVGVMVLIMGIILWGFDQLIGWGVKILTGQG